MRYPVFTVHLRATDAANLRNFQHKWKLVYTDRKKKAIIDIWQKELERYYKFNLLMKYF